MEPKLDLASITLSSDDDQLYGCEHTSSLNSDTISLSSLNYSNTVIGGGYLSPGYGAVPNVSITSNTSPYALSGGPYTVSGSNGTSISPWTTSISPKIRLDGEGADIEVNGISLMDMIGKIEQRLNILHPNEKLEEEWEELRALGEQYRKLEQHIKDKQATWDKLKAMPPPLID